MDGNVSKGAVLTHRDTIIEKLRIKKDADSALALAWKAAIKEGIEKKELKRAIEDAALTSDELVVKDRKYAFYRECLGMPANAYQAEMELGAEAATNGAADPAEVEAVAKHENNKAFESGVVAGKAGADLASCPFDPGSEEFASFSLGWSSGQKSAIEALGGATRTATAH